MRKTTLPSNLSGLSWLITGASGGIGSAFVHLLAPTAKSLILHGRNKEALEETARRAKELGTRNVTTMTSDLRTPGAGEALAHRALQCEPLLSGVVNAAGASCWGDVVDLNPGALEAELNANAQAVSEISRHLGLAFMKQKNGKILNVSSIVGFFGLPTQAAYAASKSWMISFGCALHEELKPQGIIVTTLCPGATRTSFFSRAKIPLDKRWATHATWQEPRSVARIGLIALSKEKMLCISGWKNRMAIFAVKLMPRSWIALLVARELRET